MPTTINGSGSADFHTALPVAEGGTGSTIGGGLVVVDTIAALRAISAENIASVRGHTTLGDGGGGQFYWHTTSTDTDNDGTIIKATAVTTGRWLRLYKGNIQAAWFGAIGGGTTDYITELQAALDAADASLVGLDIHAATFKNLSNQLIISTANKVVIKGAGRGLTILEFDVAATNSGGIDITYTDGTLVPEVSGIAIKTEALGAGTALKLTATAGSSIISGPVIEDIDIKGVSPATQYWITGIHLVDVWYPSISRFSIKGKSEVINPFSMTNGINFERTQGLFLNDFEIFHTENAIIQSGASSGEGINFSKFEIVGVTNGIVLTGAGGTSITDGHINAYVRGITCEKTQLSITNMLIFKTQLSTSAYVGIELLGSAYCTVANNIVEGNAAATGGMTGITSGPDTTSRYNNIHDNILRNFESTGTGIELFANANNNQVRQNFGVTNVSPIVDASASGVDNIIESNLPFARSSFAANDLTPDVSNSNSPLFATANTTPIRLITDFDNGYNGQVIDVLANDAFTTLVHGVSTISLNGSVNYAMGPGAIVTLRRDSTVWREVSRSAV